MGKIKDYLAALDDEKLLEEVKKELAAGTTPEEILGECQQAMIVIGDAFSNNQMFVSDLMMAGELFKEVGELLPKQEASGESKGIIVMGTVKDDIHDIGKDIVVNLLRASGFEVRDMGVDVEPAAFVEAVKDSGAKVLGLSCLLVSCYDSIKNTVQAIEDAGMRDKVKIIIGGGPTDQHVVDFSGADAYGAGAQDTVNYSKEVYAC